LLFAVKELELGKIPFKVSLAPGAIEFYDPKLRQATTLEVSGTAQLLPLGEIRVQGRLIGSMGAECDRCLEAMQFHLDGGFDLGYLPADAGWDDPETSLGEKESDVGFYDGEGVQLADVVREQIVLWLPMQRICRPDCRGICPQCGQNKNEIECGCREQTIDERWSALKNI